MKLRVLADKVSLFRNVHKLKTADIYKRLTLDEKAIALVCYRCFIPVKWVSLTPQLALDYYFMYYSLKLTGDEQFDFLKAVKNFSPMQWFHDPERKEISISAVLPLIDHASNTVEFQYHIMSTAKEYTQYINPSQTTVGCSDQPLYAIKKKIQWACPQQFPLTQYFPFLEGST